MVLEEQPAKVAEAVKLFLQGLGYTMLKSTRLRAASLANTPVKKHKEVPPSPGQQPQTSALIEGLQDLVLQQTTNQ